MQQSENRVGRTVVV